MDDDLKDIINKFKQTSSDMQILEDNIKRILETENIIINADTEYGYLKRKLLAILEEELVEIQHYILNREDIVNYQRELKDLGVDDYYIRKINKL